jgi:hypothetical protein
MFPSSCVWLLPTLLTIDLSLGNCIVQGSAWEFCQQEIVLKLVSCSNKAQLVAKGLMLVVDFLHQNHDSSVVIFCNSWKQSQQFIVHVKKETGCSKAFYRCTQYQWLTGQD